MLYVLAIVLIGAWVYLTTLGFRLNREGSDRARGASAPEPVADRRAAQQTGGHAPVTG